MTNNIRLITPAVLALFLAAAGAASPDSGFYLKDGDRVVFYGDSITDLRVYSTFTETFAVTRFPSLNVTFTHSGWGGDRVGGGGGGKIDARLERDVYAHKPTVVTVMLGMNDGGYRAFDQKLFDTYRDGIRHIADSVRKKLPGIRMTLIQPSAYDDVTRAPRFSGGYNGVLVRYGEAVKEIAAAAGQTTADLNAPVVAMLQKANAADAAIAAKLIPDRVHPGRAGGLVMAGELLKAWGAPALVSDVAIDAAGGRVASARNTVVSSLAVSGDGVTWAQLDGALPMPIETNNPAATLAVDASGFNDALNRQILRVTGLAAVDYELKIDGKPAGRFTAAQLAGGINLATLPTPMAAQAAEVHNLTLQRTALHNIRWRNFQVPGERATEDVRATLPGIVGELDAAVVAVTAAQRAAARPVLRHYALRGSAAAQPGRGTQP
ncbi:MAG: SGNH/GDSL hydrolase family protein [Opitutaceae bacterium]|jgi:lysophospholipase L1-like esterase|nr:SGNH/GDSL hydrolase family protein [Opitutaceae bacterium]